MTNHIIGVAQKADSGKNSNHKNYNQDFKCLTSIRGTSGFFARPTDALLVGVFLCLQNVGANQ